MLESATNIALEIIPAFSDRRHAWNAGIFVGRALPAMNLRTENLFNSKKLFE
jgi:hypothetical protein